MKIIAHGYSSLLKCEVQSGDHHELQICVEHLRQIVMHKSLMVSGKCSVTQNAKKLFKLDSCQFQWMQIIWNSVSILQAQSLAGYSLITKQCTLESTQELTLPLGNFKVVKREEWITKDNSFLQETNMGKDSKVFSAKAQLINERYNGHGNFCMLLGTVWFMVKFRAWKPVH